MCEPSGRADAADRCRGGDHRGEDKSTGSGVQAHTTDPARSGCRVAPPVETGWLTGRWVCPLCSDGQRSPQRFDTGRGRSSTGCSRRMRSEQPRGG